jgi:hypothetical protein
MSFEDRSEALHDLHGVAEIANETAEMMRYKVAELTRILPMTTSSLLVGNDALLGVEKYEVDAFQTALRLSPDYVEQLKIPCLRSDRYDVRDAATRIVRHFGRKLELFGPDLLVRDVRFDDLSKDAKHALQNGLIHLLPERDRSGRAIMFISGRLSAQYTTDTVVSVVSRFTSFIF